jgi:hypothetical protein
LANLSKDLDDLRYNRGSSKDEASAWSKVHHRKVTKHFEEILEKSKQRIISIELYNLSFQLTHGNPCILACTRRMRQLLTRAKDLSPKARDAFEEVIRLSEHERHRLYVVTLFKFLEKELKEGRGEDYLERYRSARRYQRVHGVSCEELGISARRRNRLVTRFKKLIAEQRNNKRKRRDEYDRSRAAALHPTHEGVQR